jgi:PadR family transcriptional regulator PadR
MARNRTDLVKGTLDLIVLRTLELRPMHGAAIAERIAQITKGTFDLKAGSLFPALPIGAAGLGSERMDGVGG